MSLILCPFRSAMLLTTLTQGPVSELGCGGGVKLQRLLHRRRHQKRPNKTLPSIGQFPRRAAAAASSVIQPGGALLATHHPHGHRQNLPTLNTNRPSPHRHIALAAVAPALSPCRILSPCRFRPPPLLSPPPPSPSWPRAHVNRLLPDHVGTTTELRPRHHPRQEPNSPPPALMTLAHDPAALHTSHLSISSSSSVAP